MRIGIDARLYGTEQAGLGRYVEQLIKHLEVIDTKNQYTIFLRQANWNVYQPANNNFTKVLADIPWYGLAEHYTLPKIIKKANVDIMHFPHWNVPFFYHQPFVVTIHDLILVHFPNRRASTRSSFAYTLRYYFFKLVLRHAAKAARHITTVSEFSKQDIISTLRVPKEKITVTFPAPLPVVATTTGSIPRTITKPYVLYVGAAYPHKNLDNLLAAWSALPESTKAAYQLVLAGKDTYFYQRLRTEHAALITNGNVVTTGYVDDATLAALYQKAALFVFPSLYEGFGIPPLEALTYGVPVLSSNASCLPEILGSAAAYFDPEDSTAISTAIHSAIFNKNNREITLASAKNVLARYSWKKLAEQTSAIYQNSVY